MPKPPLDGVKVLDFSRLFAGPYAGMALADLGADVIKVESPQGDDARRFGPPFLGGEGMNFMALNRDKRSVVLDLKSAQGRGIARRLAGDADVIIENFRPGVAERLGIGYDDLAEANPGVVYCSINGFGSDGEYADRPALDIVLQAMTGVMARQGGTGDPELLVVTIADTYAAAIAVQSILAALLARHRDGTGQRVEVTLFEALVAAQGYRIISSAETPMLPGLDDTAPYRAFQGADRDWLVVAVVSPPTWKALCAVLGREDLESDPRFLDNPSRVLNKDALEPILVEAFLTRPTSDWLRELEAAGVPVGPVRTVEQTVSDPWCQDRGLIVTGQHPAAGSILTMGSPYHFSATPVHAAGVAPMLGQHTRSVLLEYGYTPEELSGFLSTGAVAEFDAGMDPGVRV